MSVPAPAMGATSALAVYLLALMCLGSIFAFGLWGEDFASRFGWTAGELAFVYSCGAIGNYSCLLPGYVCDKTGPRTAIRNGFCLLLIGWIGLFAGIHARAPAGWMAFAYFLEEQGNAFVYMGISLDALQRFPSQMTGTVNGITSAAYGLGAVVWTTVHALVAARGESRDTQLDSFLPLVAGATLAAAAVAWCLAVPTEKKLSADQGPGIMSHAGSLAAITTFACFSLAPVCSLLGYLGNCAHDLGVENLTSFANTAFVLCTLGRVGVGLAFDAMGKAANAVGAMAICGAGFSIAFYKLAKLALIHQPMDGLEVESMAVLYVLLFLYGGLGPVLTCAVYERFSKAHAGTVLGGISVAVSAANALLSAYVVPGAGALGWARPLMASSLSCMLSLAPCILLVRRQEPKDGKPHEKARLLGGPSGAGEDRVVFQVV